MVINGVASMFRALRAPDSKFKRLLCKNEHNTIQKENTEYLPLWLVLLFHREVITSENTWKCGSSTPLLFQISHYTYSKHHIVCIFEMQFQSIWLYVLSTTDPACNFMLLVNFPDVSLKV